MKRFWEKDLNEIVTSKRLYMYRVNDLDILSFNGNYRLKNFRIHLRDEVHHTILAALL